MMPGVLHCAGGPGPDAVDWAAASSTGSTREGAGSGDRAQGRRGRRRVAVASALRRIRSARRTRAPEASTMRQTLSASTRSAAWLHEQIRCAPCARVAVVGGRAASVPRARSMRRTTPGSAAITSSALNGYIGVLSAPGGDRLLESIALTTGELFRDARADRRRAEWPLQPGRQVHRLRNRARNVAPNEDSEERRHARGSR